MTEHVIESTIDHTDPVFRKWVKDMLAVTVMQVKFTKADGSIRDMKCTLDPSVAVPHEKKTERQKAKNEEVLAVWDIDKGEMCIRDRNWIYMRCF